MRPGTVVRLPDGRKERAAFKKALARLLGGEEKP